MEKIKSISIGQKNALILMTEKSINDMELSIVLAKAHRASTQKARYTDTWLNCGANCHFVWNRNALKCQESLPPNSVDTCNGSAKILGQGNVTFYFNNSVDTLLCKHAKKFDQNLMSLSKFIKEYHIEFVSTDAFKKCNIW